VRVEIEIVRKSRTERKWVGSDHCWLELEENTEKNPTAPEQRGPAKFRSSSQDNNLGHIPVLAMTRDSMPATTVMELLDSCRGTFLFSFRTANNENPVVLPPPGIDPGRRRTIPLLHRP